jgi:hypothetical protein
MRAIVDHHHHLYADRFIHAELRTAPVKGRLRG